MDEAREAIDLLERQLDDRGINIFRGDDGIELVTAADLAEHLQQLEGEGPTSRLSRPLLETLAAISYLQPTTRAEVEHLRGGELCEGHLRASGIGFGRGDRNARRAREASRVRDNVEVIALARTAVQGRFGPAARE